MRVARTYTIDVENIERLKRVPNASDLINELLDKHFEGSLLRSLSEEDQKKVVELAKQGKAIEEELKKYGFR